MRKTQVHTWIAMLFCVLAVAARGGARAARSTCRSEAKAQPMQSLPAPAAALFRFLEEERLDYCVLGGAAGADDCIDLVVATSVMARMPVLLRSFSAANELELIDRREAPAGVHIYRLSCTSREERPQFLTVAVRADYMRCGHVVFTASDAVERSRARDRLRGCRAGEGVRLPPVALYRRRWDQRQGRRAVERAVAARPAGRQEAGRALLASGPRGGCHPARGSVG